MLLLLLACCAVASFVSAQTVSITFLDEWGEQTSRVLEHGRAMLRVIDPGADVSSGPDTVPVALDSTILMDSGFTELAETGDSTGVFEGEVDLTTDFYLNYLDDPNHLLTQARTYDPVALDTANATYNGVTGSAEAAPSLTDLLRTDADRSPASFAQGESVRVRVRDRYADLNSGRDSTTVSVSGSGGDTELLTALETGSRTGVFEAVLPLRSGSPVSGDGRLQAGVGATITAVHADANGFSSSSDNATVAAAAVTFLDLLESRPTDVYVEGGTVLVRVVDLAADTNPGTFDTVTAGLSMLLSGDAETLTLRETGPATGVFEGAMYMGVGYQYSGNQRLESQPQHDTATVAYGSLTDSAGITGSIVRLLDESGVETSSVAPGSTLRVRVETQNQKSSTSVDFADVVVSAQPESELVRLWETGPATGVFEGEIRIGQGLGDPNDGQVQAQAGDTLRVEHADANGVTLSIAEAAVVRSALRFLDLDGLPTAVVLEQAPARVQVLDLLSAGQTPPAASIASNLGQDLESLSLSEVAGSAGLFEASIPVVSGYGYHGDGSLAVSIGTWPVNHPDTVTAEANGASAQAATAPAILEIVDDQGLPVTTSGPGATLHVRAVAPRENLSAASPDDFYAVVKSKTAGDMEYLVLVETGPNTSVFEDELPIIYSEAYAEPSAELFVRSRDTVTVTYDPPNYPYSSDDDLVVASVAIVPVQVELVDGQGLGVSAYLFGETVHLRAFEAGANADSGSAETLAVNVQAWRRSDDRADLETVTLTETGPDTGVFAGSVPTQMIGYVTTPAWNSGVLEIPEPSPYGSEDTTVTASRGEASDSARMKDSEVVFTDASGQDAESYEIGSTAYIRLRRPLADTSPGADSDTVQVWTRTYYSVDLETVVLTETGGSTGLFTGSIPTVSQSLFNSGNGVLEAEAGFVIQVDKQVFYGLRAFDQATLTEDTANLPPDAVDDAASTNEDQAVTIALRSNDSDPDGDPLTITGLGQGSKGAASINAGSTVTYTPFANANGSDTFTYSISDGRGGSDTATVAVAIAPVNDAPVTATDYATTNEDTPITLAVKNNDTDIDGDALNVIAVGQATKGAVVLDAGGTVTYTPNANATGSDYFSYTVSDGNGGTDIGTVLMTIVGVNDPPDAVNDTASTNEDTVVSIFVRSNDNDPDGNALTITAVTQGSKGSVTINAGAHVIYTPVLNANGSDSFTYTISDGQGGTDTATVSMTINPVNDAPKANADSVTTNEDTPVTLDPRVNDTDVDGDALTITFVSQPNRGSAVINGNGTVTYTPIANLNGPDQFLYTIVDGHGGTWSEIVSVSVTPVNDAPDAFNDLISTPEDTPITISVLSNDTDRENDTLTVTAVTQPSQGTAVINNGTTITYTPNLNTNDSDSFTYTVIDGHGGSDTATVYMTITPVNDPPVAGNDTGTVNEDGSVILSVRDNDSDPDGGTLTITAVTQGAHGAVTIVNSGTQVRYQPAANYFGPDTFTYTVRDPANSTAIGTVSMTVNSVNDAPDAVNDSATTNEDTPLTVSVRSNDTDVEGDSLTITAVTQALKGSVTINAGATVTYTPNANVNGGDSFTYTLSDGNGGTDTATVSITITAVNDAPDAVNDSATTNEDTPTTLSVRTNDTDVEGNTLTITAVTQGTKGSVAINGGTTVTYTPNANANGGDSFTYTISDGNGGTDTATVSITITAVNDAPDAVNDSVATDEDTPVTVSVRSNDTDVEGNTLTITSVTQGTKGSVTINAGATVTYTPNANANGADTFTYTISDGSGGVDTATVAVTINPVNDLPVAVTDSATTNENVPVAVSVLANDSDIDGGTLSVSAVTQGTRGSVTTNGTTVTYTPAAGTNGADAFTYTVSDGQGGTATASVGITVFPVNDPPVAAPDSGATRENVPVSISVLANDTDPEGNPLTVTFTSTPPNGGTSRQPDNTVIYYPHPNFTGTETFTYTVSDGQGGTSIGQVTVVVGEALERVAVLATNSVALRTSSDVISGDVIVNQAGAGPFLNGAELSVGGTVTTPTNYDVEGDSLTVAAGAVVGSNVRYNQLTNNGTINGTQTASLPLPVFSALPAFLTATPSTTNVTVNQNGTLTLAAGSYQDLTVGRKGTVTFTGGVYHFRSITVDREAKLYFSAASEVRVQQKLSTKITTTIGPAAGATIDASSILLYVAGINGTTGALAATPKAVEIGADNILKANLYAPNGTIWLQDSTQATGALLGKDIDVGINVQVTLDSAFAGGQ
ncbi:MAG: Ig-like domain-containing protein [Acidobacteriota bacterium]